MAAPTSPSPSSDAGPAGRVRPLLRVRQMRDFTAAGVTPAQLDAIADAARWSGSSQNSQPWRFIVISDTATVRQIGQAALPQTRSLQTAAAAIAIALPEDSGRAVSHAFDEGRAAERIMIAASLLDLGAGISWVMPDARAAVARILGLPAGWLVRTMVALGHPSPTALQPKSAPGTARLPRDQVVFEDRWPSR
jgi:nitroreductase